MKRRRRDKLNNKTETMISNYLDSLSIMEEKITNKKKRMNK
jgi:hypothetical protein